MVSLYRHFERSREIFIAARESVRMRHSINDALTLRFSAISHLLFIGVQERSLGYARDDDTRNGCPKNLKAGMNSQGLVPGS